MPTMNDKETIKDYFTYLYKISNLSKTDFAKELGVSQPVVSNVLTGGRDVSSNIIKNVYLKYGIDLETITNKETIKKIYWTPEDRVTSHLLNDKIKNLMVQVESNNDSNLIRIPYFNVKAAAGNGIENLNTSAEDYYYFDRRLLPKIDTSNLSVITASGDSMDSCCNKPSDIKDGDLLIVNHNNTNVVDGGIYVFLINNKDLRVKKFQVELDGSWKIISNNKEYATEIYKCSKEEQINQVNIRIIGKVLWNGSRGII